MRIIDLATGTATSADNIAIDSSSGGTRKVPILSTINGLIHAVVDPVQGSLTSLSEYVGTDSFSGTLSAAVTACQSAISALQTSVQSLAGRMTAAESGIKNRLQVMTMNLNPGDISCAAGVTTVIYNWDDMSAVLPSGATLKAATFNYATGSLMYPANLQVNNGRLYFRLFNPSANAIVVSNLVMQLFYTV